MSDELGPLSSTHKGRIAAGGIVWYIAGLMFAAGAYAFLSGLVTMSFERLPGALGGMAIGGVGLLYGYVKYAQTLAIHQHGFVWKRFLRAPIVVRWDQVKAVRVETWRERRTLHTKGEHTEIAIDLTSGGTVTLTNDIDRVDDVRGYLRSGGGSSGAAPAASPWG